MLLRSDTTVPSLLRRIHNFGQVFWQLQIKIASSVSEPKTCLSPRARTNKLGQGFGPADGPRRGLAHVVAGTFTNHEKRLDACEDQLTGKSVWQHWLGLSLRESWRLENIRCEKAENRESVWSHWWRIGVFGYEQSE
jgi:hypothetical protein